ncbi:hypothetical protein [Kutzneria chonburiensis]|uniref:Secreted protein n=1 Tax=Kutzneria chonburiensis TaxID=1483604 RepID=A0ABV6MK96_9PSEU|nr:hypothetical protein [Kutzneria chonburiensis]
MHRSLSRVATGLAALALTVTPVVATAVPAAAATGHCSDAYQVGSTKVVPDEHGQSAMSIKQYWSPRCQENYAYAYVWQQFRDSHPGSWTISVGEIWVKSPGVETNPVADTAVNTRQAELWSPGFYGAGRCTYATAALFWGNYDADGNTDKRCG